MQGLDRGAPSPASLPYGRTIAARPCVFLLRLLPGGWLGLECGGGLCAPARAPSRAIRHCLACTGTGTGRGGWAREHAPDTRSPVSASLTRGLRGTLREAAACARALLATRSLSAHALSRLSIYIIPSLRKKPILAFLATGQHGAAELRVGPDGRLSGRAAITKAAARRRATRGTPNGTILGLAVAGLQRRHRHTLCCGLTETAQRNRGASALHLSKPHNNLLS
eukprot:scaffold2507_cov122-Isochrysis_galbana.AAC.20